MVIGDMIADVYLEGNISRISREAPVLVLEYKTEIVVPGGAANVVHNAATLGGNVYAVGVIGQDSSGEELLRLLQSKSVNIDGFYKESKRPTITKTRVIAGGQATVRQQVVRIDRETKNHLQPETENHLLINIDLYLPKMDAIILSDYGSQSITPAIRTRVIALCRKFNVPCIVDSRYNILDFKGVNIAKQNEAELSAAVGYSIEDDNSLIQAGNELLNHLAADSLLITRGPDGITLFEADGKFQHIPVTNASEVFDVSGAGDTVVATMMLALASKASLVDAARLANYAAGVVIKKLGTATTTQDELIEALGEENEDS